MILSIIKPDNVVIIDGISARVDLSPLPDSFHALQWGPMPPFGEEYGDLETRDEYGSPVNELCPSLDEYQWVVEAHAMAIAAEASRVVAVKELP